MNLAYPLGDKHWRKVAATFEKAESANSLPFAVCFHVGVCFCMGAYKRDVVVVIKMGAYFVWVLIIPNLRYYSRMYLGCRYIIITIVQDHSGKYHEFVAVCIVTSAQHKQQYQWQQTSDIFSGIAYVLW